MSGTTVYNITRTRTGETGNGIDKGQVIRNSLTTCVNQQYG